MQTSRRSSSSTSQRSFAETGFGSDVGVGPDQKGELLREIRIKQNPSSITYIGDSHTDTEAFVKADTAVLFDPDERIPETAIDEADTIVESADIREVQNLIPRM
nr:hypothetical protein [Haloarcula hispanica]